MMEPILDMFLFSWVLLSMGWERSFCLLLEELKGRRWEVRIVR